MEPLDDFELKPVELLEGLDSLVAVLPARRQVFVNEYLKDLNASAAATRAGYSAAAGSALLADTAVSAAIEVCKAQRLSRTHFDQDRVLDEMSLLAHSDISHYLVDDDGNVTLAPGAPEGAMKAVQSVSKKTHKRTDKDGTEHVTHDVTIKLWDKPNPLKLLGKHAGLFPDKVELSGKDGAPLFGRIERVIVDPKQELLGHHLEEGGS